MKRLRSAQISPSIARPSGDFWWGVIWDYQVKCSKALLSVHRSTGAALDLWKVIRKPLSPMNWLSRDYQLTCQSHRVWARPCLGPAKDSAVWCPDGRSQRNGCRPDSWRAGTCTTVKWIYTSHEVSKAVIKHKKWYPKNAYYIYKPDSKKVGTLQIVNKNRMQWCGSFKFQYFIQNTT